MRQNTLCTLNIPFIISPVIYMSDKEYKALSYGLDHHILTPTPPSLVTIMLLKLNLLKGRGVGPSKN